MTYNGQLVPERAAGYPTAVANAANGGRDQVREIARLIIKYPIPNIDLLKIGFVF